MSTIEREVYAHSDTARTLDPRVVAIVGASPRAGSASRSVLGNVEGFKGRFYCVNPQYGEVDGRVFHPSLRALPEVPDCVIAMTRRDTVEAVAHECAALGVGGLVVFASGYAETGREDGRRDQERLAAIGREAGLRIIGPNCAGIINYRSGLPLTFASVPRVSPCRPQSIGLVSQSGALGFSLAQAVQRGVSLSHVLCAGNSCDVDVADHINFLAGDPGCTAIACVFEGISSPERLLQAAANARRAGKPVIVHKLGRGDQGAVAAMSHTGSLAGSAEAFLAVFERAGFITVDNFEALIPTAAFFSKAKPPAGVGVAVAATSGGAAIIAADCAEKHAVPLPQPAPDTHARVRSRIPDFAAARNPFDITAQVFTDPAALADCVEALLGDPAYGALVNPTTVASTTSGARYPVFNSLAAQHGKMVCIVSLSEWLDAPGLREAEALPSLAVFRSMDQCFAALGAWWNDYRRSAASLDRSGRLTSRDEEEQACRVLAEEEGAMLTERAAKRLLAACGLDVVTEEPAASAEDAVRAADQIGYPVALKIASVDIAHKTEVGGLRLDLASPGDVARAFDQIVGNVRQAMPQARIDGVLVQPMLPKGVEMMIGARIDPVFGPLVMVGMGGILVELMKDTQTALAPVTREEALALLRRLNSYPLLEGFRGAEPADIRKLVDAICRVSEFAASHRGSIRELDINPLICVGGKVVVADALVVRTAAAEST